jgi:hypothetical protein
MSEKPPSLEVALDLGVTTYRPIGKLGRARKSVLCLALDSPLYIRTARTTQYLVPISLMITACCINVLGPQFGPMNFSGQNEWKRR